MPPTSIPEAALSRMRKNAIRLLPDECVIQEKVRTDDEAASYTEAWLDVTTVRCRVDPITSSSSEVGVIADREMTLVMYTLTTEYNAPLAEGRRIVHDGETYEITRLVDKHSQRVYREAEITRVG